MRRDRGEKRHFLRKYEMRWGINEVETQEGGSRWLERRLCRGGERRWGRARGDGGLAGLGGGRRSGLGPLRRRGWRSGSRDIAGWLCGALFTVFQTRGNANTPRTRAQRGAWHCWSPALAVSGNGCKSNKSLTSTLPSSTLYSQLGMENDCRVD